MVTFYDIIMELAKRKIEVTLTTDRAGIVVADLDTRAKSRMILYPTGKVEMRYNKVDYLDFCQPMDEVLRDLYCMFETCLHGRDYYNHRWVELGDSL